MPAAIAIPSLISAGTSLAGGILGSRASGKAADIQSQNAAKVAQMATDASKQAAEGVNAAAGNAVNAVTGATGQANQTLADIFGLQSSALSPYMQAGQQGVTSLMEGLAPGGALTQQFAAPTAAEAAATPGFQFQMEEAMKALNRSAAAKGLSNAGGTLRELNKYGQNVASTYYQNAFDNAMKTFQMNRQNTLTGLGTLANLGQFGTGQFNAAADNFGNRTAQNQLNLGLYTGNTGLNAAQYGGNALMSGTQTAAQALTGGSNAQAAGVMGGANAWQGALGGIGNAGMYAAGNYSGSPSSTQAASGQWGVPNRPFVMAPDNGVGTAPLGTLLTVPSYLKPTW